MRIRAASIALVLALSGPVASEELAVPNETGGSDMIGAPTLPLADQASPPGETMLMVETPDPGPDHPPLMIMTIDQDAVFLKSRWGMRVQTELDRRGDEIAAENERLANDFSAEEDELTKLRGTLAPDEFRKRAEEFDKRVVEVRRQRDSVARQLQDEIEEERASFFRAALPILAQLMQERGAVIVLDQRSIFVSAQSVDVTDDLVARMDRLIGEGPVAPSDAETSSETATEGRENAPSKP
ncbi:OmpH family outer membrane protein [Paracoccus sp. MBLB3053]|uniref:OmpH family outer membrane protein n=1 Tax=Paracoccus aurantius TaxID=3073814 RepID=A0ABU2HSV5_9RHOB|nr:OmpH family outer membrane protein [Paracoccus sp. MBLB3053]MDS9468132.1 OmpH family outer membrane protein [Paracoccus sp. MBLB3053]